MDDWEDASLLDDNSSVVYQRPAQWWKRLNPSMRASAGMDQIVTVNTVTVERREQVIVVNQNRPSIDDQFYLSPVNSFGSCVSTFETPNVRRPQRNLFKRSKAVSIPDDPPIENANGARSYVFEKENSHYTDFDPESICSSPGESLQQILKPRRTIFRSTRLSERGKKKSLYVEALARSRRSSVANEKSKEQIDFNSSADDEGLSNQKLENVLRKRKKSMLAIQPTKVAKDDSHGLPSETHRLNTTAEKIHRIESDALSDSTIMSIDDSHRKNVAPTKSIFKVPRKNLQKDKNKYLAAISWDRSKSAAEGENFSEIANDGELGNQKVTFEKANIVNDVPHEDSLQLSPMIGTPASSFKNLASSTVIGESLSPRSTISYGHLKRPSWRLSAVSNEDRHVSEDVREQKSIPEIVIDDLQDESKNQSSRKSITSKGISNEKNYHEINGLSQNKSQRNIGIGNDDISMDGLITSANRNNSMESTPEDVRRLKSMRDADSININFLPKKTLTPVRFSTALQNNTDEKLQSLNQSDIDRAYLEEMKARRTNPPVRNSIFIHRDPSIEMNDDQTNYTNDNEELVQLYPMRHSEIPIPIHVPEPVIDESDSQMIESHKKISSKKNISTTKKDLVENISVNTLHQVDKTKHALEVPDVESQKTVNNNSVVVDHSHKEMNNSVNISINNDDSAKNPNVEILHQPNKTNCTLEMPVVENSENVENNIHTAELNNLPVHNNIYKSVNISTNYSPCTLEVSLVEYQEKVQEDVKIGKINQSPVFTKLNTSNRISINKNNSDKNLNIEALNQTNKTNCTLEISAVENQEKGQHDVDHIAMNHSIGHKSMNLSIHKNNSLENHVIDVLNNTNKMQQTLPASSIDDQDRVQDISSIELNNPTAHKEINKTGNFPLSKDVLLEITNVDVSNQTNDIGILKTPVIENQDKIQDDADISTVNKSPGRETLNKSSNISTNRNDPRENPNIDVHQTQKTNSILEVSAVENQKKLHDGIKVDAINHSSSIRENLGNNVVYGEISAANNVSIAEKNISINKSLRTSKINMIESSSNTNNENTTLGKESTRTRISNISSENIFNINEISSPVNSFSMDSLNRNETSPEKNKRRSSGLLKSIAESPSNISYNMNNFITVDEVGDESSKQSSFSMSVNKEDTQKSNRVEESNFQNTDADTTSNINYTMDFTLVDGVAGDSSNPSVDQLRSSVFGEDVNQLNTNERSNSPLLARSIESQDESNYEASQSLIINRSIFAKLNYKEMTFGKAENSEDPSTDKHCQRILDKIINSEKQRYKWINNILNDESKLDEFLGKTKVLVGSPIKPAPNKSEKPRIVHNKNVNLQKNNNPYKKPKLYMKESWITKHLYKFIQDKLEPKYGIKALMKSEKFIIYLAKVVNEVIKRKQDSFIHVENLKETMAQLDIVYSHEDFHRFCRDFMPFYFQIKAIPACGLDVPGIQGGVFDPIREEED